jgi:hypothetical protein
MTSRLRIILVAALIGLFNPGPLFAQGTPLSEILVNLIQSEIRLAPPTPPNPSHEAHFIPGTDA